ncbi:MULTISPECIES: hypothetical protein [Xanthomonas]|uniref:hypothetical protein n=1 Tax=Xanthomonas TaxID=338 RepID=UPI000CEE015D|nr:MULTISPECIES: hypothetical protein [Xanthomonas]MCF8818949.1 hypothetical protein [Xanthomonas campestris]PPU44628.1 hypothetical protein XarbCFBP7697_01560 [Xanthomonas arboricola]
MAIEDDKRELHQFIHELFHWLEWCHFSRGRESEYEWPILHPRNEFQPLAQHAWLEFSRSQPEDSFHASLNEVSEQQMVAAGLFGDQLRYKLRVLRDRALRALGGSDKVKEKFADFLETLLESLLDLLGAGTAVKELVGTLKAQLR